MIPNKPGLYADIPFDDYLNIDAADKTTLWGFDRSAAHVKYDIDHPKESTEDLDIGSALHGACLEPDQFAAQFCTAPRVDRRTKAGKATWAEFQESNGEKVVLTAENMDIVRGMSDAIFAHPYANALLHSEGKTEFTVVWRDEDTGQLCKARLDKLIRQWEGYMTVVDIKSTRDASPFGFARECAKFGYYMQDAAYLEGLDSFNSGIHRRFFFIAVEKTPPYCVAVYELGEQSLEIGRSEWRQYLRQYKQCVETGEWPGYSETLTQIELPHWKLRETQYVD